MGKHWPDLRRLNGRLNVVYCTKLAITSNSYLTGIQTLTPSRTCMKQNHHANKPQLTQNPAQVPPTTQTAIPTNPSNTGASPGPKVTLQGLQTRGTYTRLLNPKRHFQSNSTGPTISSKAPHSRYPDVKSPEPLLRTSDIASPSLEIPQGPHEIPFLQSSSRRARSRLLWREAKSPRTHRQESGSYQNARSANDRKHSDLRRVLMGIRPHGGQRTAGRISSYMQT